MEPVSVAFLRLSARHPARFHRPGPGPLAARQGQARLCLEDREPVPTDAGFSILPTATFDEIGAADILCVPGGIGCVDVMRG